MNDYIKNDLRLRYVQNQIRDASDLLAIKSRNNQGKSLAARHLLSDIEKSFRGFLGREPAADKWLVMPGLRGVGKTTLMAQAYIRLEKEFGPSINLFYASLDEISHSANLSQILMTYEELLQTPLKKIKKPTFIFIDEAQFDPNWAQVLKVVYDWSQFVFLFVSGSSAINLQMGADVVGRRATVLNLLPLDFGEYQQLHFGHKPVTQLSQKLVDCLYFSKDAAAVYRGLKSLEPLVNQAWIKYDRSSLGHYFSVGSLPFSKDRSILQVQQSLKDITDKIIRYDLSAYRKFKFNAGSSQSLKLLLMVLADAGDVIKTTKLLAILGVSRAQLFDMYRALLISEVLIKIPPLGSNFSIIKKPARYNFMSPSLRLAHSSLIKASGGQRRHQGVVLDDLASLHYYKLFELPDLGQLTYPYDKSGAQADFILKFMYRSELKLIALEFGLGSKNAKQVSATITKFNCSYGLLFSGSPLQIIGKQKIVSVPLDYFYLI